MLSTEAGTMTTPTATRVTHTTHVIVIQANQQRATALTMVITADC
jgi:hypothetical protein